MIMLAFISGLKSWEDVSRKKLGLPPQAEATQDYHHWPVLLGASTAIRDQPVRIKAFSRHTKHSLRTSDTIQSQQDSGKPKL